MKYMIKTLMVIILLTGVVVAKELPSWGMTESQYKMPNFTNKMQKIGDQAVKNDWLLKITAPKDWHGKIRAALSQQGAKNVQINFKDSLYKSITISATPGMELKSTTVKTTQPAVAKKQVVIDKPEMDTEIEAPEFDNNFKAGDILADMDELELTLPDNGKTEKKPRQITHASNQQVVKADSRETSNQPETSQSDAQNQDKALIKENLRKRYARSKTVDRTISYENITDEDELFVSDDVVLVKRYVNRGVAIYYWMQEAYNPETHHLIDKGSGKFAKIGDASSDSEKPIADNRSTDEDSGKIDNPAAKFFDFVAVTDDLDRQDQLRRDYIRNKSVNNTIKASQLNPKDILYVSNHTVLVERPLGNSRSAYFWLVGDTRIEQPIEHTGPNKFVIQ